MELKSYRQSSGTVDETAVDVPQINDNNNNNNEDIVKTKINLIEEPVIKLTDVSISFYKKTVFKNLNISVPNGKVYAILGPKNCGKSLILQCIAGLIKPTEGKVTVMDCCPKVSTVIGYMPQEISLFDDLTVEETMKYFGQLYDVPKQLVWNKIEFLLNSITTTGKSSLIRCLANNDKVVVSLAIAVLHSPKILILDEPTVYCDPLLKKSVWNQLKDLSDIENVTIIMTTNHMEEAKHADTVGFIRNGCLREEQLTKHWQKEFNLNSIEDLFINLFHQKDKSEKCSVVRPFNRDNDNNNKISMNKICLDEINLSPNLKQLHKITTSSAKRISALYYKNLKGQLRNPPVLIFQLLFPALAVAMFCACIGHNPYEIPVGVYNPDRPPFISDLVLKSFNPKSIQLKHYETFDSAYDAVRQHQVWAILVFPHNYTRSMLQRSSQGCESPEDTELDVEDEVVEESVIHTINVFNDTVKVSNESIDDNYNTTGSEIEDKSLAEDKRHDSDDYELIYETKPKLFTTIDLYMDNTNLLISGAIKAHVIQALKKAKNRSADMNSGGGYAPPLQIIDPNIYGSTEAIMSEFITPGIIIAIVFLSSTLFPGLNIIRERRERQLERSTIAGVKAYEVIIAHLMIHIVILIAQISFILFFTFVVFDLPLIGSIYLVFALIFTQGLNGLVYSIAISSFCRTEIQALIIWLTTFSVVIILSGTFWPIECMPRLAIFIGQFLPQTIAGNGLRSILSRGWDLSYLTIQLSLLVPLIWIVILFIASILLFRIRK